MKHGFAFLGLAFAILIGCGSTGSNTSGNQTGSAGNSLSPSPSPVPANPFFTGTGCKEMSLGILVPESTGLDENQAYLPNGSGYAGQQYIQILSHNGA